MCLALVINSPNPNEKFFPQIILCLMPLKIVFVSDHKSVTNSNLCGFFPKSIANCQTEEQVQLDDLIKKNKMMKVIDLTYYL